MRSLKVSRPFCELKPVGRLAGNPPSLFAQVRTLRYRRNVVGGARSCTWMTNGCDHRPCFFEASPPLSTNSRHRLNDRPLTGAGVIAVRAQSGLMCRKLVRVQRICGLCDRAYCVACAKKSVDAFPLRVASRDRAEDGVLHDHARRHAQSSNNFVQFHWNPFQGRQSHTSDGEVHRQLLISLDWTWGSNGAVVATAQGKSAARAPHCGA